MVRSRARFDSNQTRLKVGKESHDLTTSKLPAEKHSAILRNTVNLEHMLGDIETYSDNCHGELL